MKKGKAPKTAEVKNADVVSQENNYEKIACPYCLSIRADVYRKASDIVKCSNCGTVYLRTRLKQEAMELLYQSYNTDAPQMFLPKDQNEIKNSMLRRDYWIKEILQYTKAEGNILDIGCGWGAFLDNARTYGFSPRGIEITKKGADFAKTKLNINATSDQFLDTPLEKKSFKVITLNHVLEHLPEPKMAMEKIYDLLIPGGLFCGIVPNVESLCSFFMGDAWEWLDPFYHYVHYSPTTVRKHLENAGFVIEKIYTASGDYNRAELANVLKTHYRPSHHGMIPEIIKKIEMNGQGEEIRFIARKPAEKEIKINESNDYSIVKSRNKNHAAYTASIIIPVYNKVEYTQKCLETIYSIKNGIDDFEVLVVNNASSDETAKFLELACSEYHDLKVVNNSINKRFAGACNTGALNAEAEFLVFLNNDTVPEENWLLYGINRLKIDHTVGIVGSKLLYPDRTIQHCGVEYLLNVHHEYPIWPVHRFLGLKEDDPLVNQGGFVESVTGACLFIPNRLFKEIEGFDEGYSMYFEDLDLCFKSMKAEKKIFYEPNSVVIHFEGKSTPDEALRYKLSTNAAKRFYEKWQLEITSLTEFKKQQDVSVEYDYPLSYAQTFETNKRTINFLVESSRYNEANDLLNELKKFIPSDPVILDYEERFKILNSSKEERSLSSINDIYDSKLKHTQVSILTLTYNALEYTKEFISSLLQHSTLDYELIVIDNNSSDETVNYLKSIEKNYENIRVILNKENIGFPAAINQGLLECNGKYIIIVNNDIVVTKRWLESLIEVAESDPKIGLVGPISNEVSGLQKDENAKYKSIEEMHKYAANVTKTNKGEILNFPRIAFLCTLIKKEVIEKIGGLDERFTPGNYEDDDFCLRAQLAGFKTVIAKDVFIHHYGSKSFKAEGIKKYADQLEINKQKFIGKWGVTPDELWIQRKEIKPHQYYYPINKNKFDEHFERAKILLADQELDLACESIQKALENFNEVENRKNQIELNDLLDLAGNLALANGDIELAQKYFEEELNIQPNSSTACAGLGEVFAVQGLFENAKTMFEWAIKNDPNNQTAIDSLALTNKELGFEPIHNSLEEETA
ncbi:MAG: glycosyltransferase [Melioribacteraceae bacterium]|nr:glycosyltransferase [Melioribacteraceae bacterium]